MARQLLILRHGKSDWETVATDIDRPLKERGKRSARRIGLWLQQQRLVPDHIVTSPAKRARLTAESVCQSIGQSVDSIVQDSRIYEAGVSNLLDVLADCPDDAHCVLLVGHNPGLEILLSYLSGNTLTRSGNDKLLPTAALAQLEMPDRWNNLHNDSAQLITLIRPRSLPDN
jgi:phosphohistidine phosphatase